MTNLKKMLSLAVLSIAVISLNGASAFAADTPKVPTYSISCGTNCTGQPTAKLAACSNTAVTRTVRYFAYVNNVAVGSYDVKKGKCASKSFAVTDGSIVTSKYCYLNAAGTACATARTSIGTARTVVVPQPVALRIDANMSDFEAVVFNTTAFIPVGSAYFTLEIVRADGTRIPLTSNGVTTNSLSLGNGGNVDYSFVTAYDDNFTYQVSAYEDSAYTVRSGCEVNLNISVL